MNPAEQAQAQAAIATNIAGCAAQSLGQDGAGTDWVHLFMDFEIDASGERSSSISFALVQDANGVIEKHAFRLSPDVKRQLSVLAGAMTERRWTCVQLRMERDGRYAFDYLYTPPYRLGGGIVDTRFERYADEWRGSGAGDAVGALRKPWWRIWGGR